MVNPGTTIFPLVDYAATARINMKIDPRHGIPVIAAAITDAGARSDLAPTVEANGKTFAVTAGVNAIDGQRAVCEYDSVIAAFSQRAANTARSVSHLLYKRLRFHLNVFGSAGGWSGSGGGNAGETGNSQNTHSDNQFVFHRFVPS
jgi:hypothetical protein